MSSKKNPPKFKSEDKEREFWAREDSTASPPDLLAKSAKRLQILGPLP